MMWKFIVIFSLHCIFGSTDLIDGPVNTVAIVGQRMEMKCKADGNYIVREWTLQRSFTSGVEMLFVNLKDRKKIENTHFGIADGNDGVLYTTSTEMDDAGIYNCTIQKIGGQPNRYSAYLIVFETEPLCESSLSTTQNNIVEEGTSIWMSCAFNFSGSWTPTIEWTMHEDSEETDEKPTDLTDSANVDIYPSASISSSVMIVLNETSNSTYVSSKIYFKLVNNHQMVTAKNTPNYIYIWKSPMVKVIHVPPTPTPEKMMTTEVSAEITDSRKDMNGMDLKTISLVVLSTLFGATVFAVVVMVICKGRKKHPGSSILRLEQPSFERQREIVSDASPAEYQAIISFDEYDTIGEFAMNSDVMIAHCCSQSEEAMPVHNNYYALTPTKEENPIYTDIATYSQLKPDMKSKGVDDTYLQPVDMEELNLPDV